MKYQKSKSKYYQSRRQKGSYKMKSVLDEEQIANIIQKLYFYKRLENINFDEIKNSMNNMNNYYKTGNTNLLNNMYQAFSNKFKTRNDYTETNIFIYSKNLENYQKVARENSFSFDNDIFKG